MAQYLVCNRCLRPTNTTTGDLCPSCYATANPGAREHYDPARAPCPACASERAAREKAEALSARAREYRAAEIACDEAKTPSWRRGEPAAIKANIDATIRLDAARRAFDAVLASPPSASPAAREVARVEGTPAAPAKRSCNRHDDCDAADRKVRENNPDRRGAEHCHDDCCEDCFGS